MSNGATTWVHVASVGAATGMRSSMPLATASWSAATGRLQVKGGILGYIADLDVAGCLVLMACGEVLADKSGLLPSRTAFGPLQGRMAFGAVAGAVLADSTRLSRTWGATIGAASAGISAVVTHHIRLALDSAGLPDTLVALVEDFAVLMVSRWATMRGNIPPH